MVKAILKREGVRQFIKFAIVGLFNTVVDWVIFSILKIPLSSNGQTGKQLAKAGSFVVSATSSFFMNRTWTFKPKNTKIHEEGLKFFLVALVGLAINNFVFYLVTASSGLHLSDILGLIAATAAATFWNFFGNKLWTFKS